MKVDWLCPDDCYDFFREMVPSLRSRGVKVSLSPSTDSDVTVGCILPLTHGIRDYVENHVGRYVAWHWDLYSFQSLDAPHWRSYLGMLPGALDVWSGSYHASTQLKEFFGHDSCVIPAWVDRENLRCLPVEDSVFYAATTGSVGKRVDWAKRACEMLGVKLVLGEGQGLPREEYLRRVASCRVYLNTSFEESNGSIPAMEAAANGRPVVCADIPSNREVFGDTVEYFDSWNFGDLLRVLRSTLDRTPLQGPYHDTRAKTRILNLFSQEKVADRIVKRLKEIV